jgi:CRP/FNR family transcriptional regulator
MPAYNEMARERGRARKRHTDEYRVDESHGCRPTRQQLAPAPIRFPGGCSGIPVIMPEHRLSLVISNDAMAPTQCGECAIRHRGACMALTDVELTALGQIARRRRIQAGKVILSEAQPSELFANIVSGVVKFTKMLRDGREQIVGLQFPSDFLGRIYGAENPYSAEAVTDVELCCFPLKEFRRLLKEHPNLEHRLLENTLDELDAAREWMLLLGRKTAKEKVSSFLEMIARRTFNIGCAHYEPAENAVFSLPVTRADIADYLGLTLETVSRQIAGLKADGIIAVAANNRQITISDVEALARAACHDQ